MGESESELSKLVDQLNRSAISAKPSEKKSLDPIFALAFQRNASDIILVAGSPVTLRVNGALTPHGEPLSAEDIRSMLLPWLAADRLSELQERKSLDFCFVRPAIGRFRANFQLSARHARGGHSSFARTGSTFPGLAQFAAIAGHVDRAKTGTGAFDRTNGLRQDVDARGVG